MVQLETVGSQHWTIVNYISVSLFTFNGTIIYFIRVHVNLIVCFYDEERYCDHFWGLLFFVFALFSWSVIVWYPVWKQVQNIGWMSVDLRNFFGR